MSRQKGTNVPKQPTVPPKPKREPERIIKLTNGAVLIVKVNQLMDYDQYVNFYKSIKQSIQDGSMLVLPGVDVIVIDKEGKAVKV